MILQPRFPRHKEIGLISEAYITLPYDMARVYRTIWYGPPPF